MKLGRKLWTALCLALAMCLCAQVALPVTTGVVTKAQAAAKVKLNKTKATIYTGQKLQLKLTGTNDKVTWSSSDKSIAKVDRKGKVTAKKPGKATITAKVGKKKYKCTVTVKAAIKVKNKKIEINQGDTVEVDVVYYADGTIDYESSNEQVVTCEWDGDWRGDHTSLYITGEKAGTATVTLTNDKSKDKIKIQVTVKGATPTPEILTGDINGILGKDKDEINAQLPDKLRYFRSGAYTNDYVLVETNSYNAIVSVSLLTDASSGIGKYTLFGLYPGLGFNKAVQLLSGDGWKQGSNGSDYSYFYCPARPDTIIYVTIINGSVDLISYLYN